MDSTPALTTQDAMATQMAATERLEPARTGVRIAERRIECSVRGLPLREQVADSERIRRADAALAVAQAAFDAARDLDCADCES